MRVWMAWFALVLGLTLWTAGLLCSLLVALAWCSGFVFHAQGCERGWWL